MTGNGMDFLEHKLWQQCVALEPDAIADALAMTYRAQRYSEQARLKKMAATNVTLAADLMLFRKR